MLPLPKVAGPREFFKAVSHFRPSAEYLFSACRAVGVGLEFMRVVEVCGLANR